MRAMQTRTTRHAVMRIMKVRKRNSNCGSEDGNKAELQSYR